MIGVIIALESEFERIIGEGFELVGEIPYKEYRGKIKDKDILVVISGVGKANAAGATQYLCSSEDDIERVINIGVCGASIEAYKSSPTVEIGEILEEDFDTSAVDGEEFVKNKITLPTCNSDYPLYTQDHFVTECRECGYYDMEGYAVASIASKNGHIPTIIKSVTDIIDSGEQDKEYRCNFETACSELKNKLAEII